MGCTCELCGAEGDADKAGGSIGSSDAPLGWSVDMTSGRARRLCERCTRSHVRDIEAKLDESWWSDPAPDG